MHTDGWRLALVAALVQSAAYGIYLAVGGELLNVDSDDSLFTWVSSMLTFTAALLLLERRPVRLWAALAAAVALLSADDMLAIHEQVDRHVGPFPAWPLVFGPLLMFVFAGLWPVASVRLGLLLLVAAVGCEFATAAVFALDDEGGWLYHAEALVEEALELAGWVLIVLGLYRHSR